MEPLSNKILITVPAHTARGGITNYYQTLKSEFSENVEYFVRGARTWPVRKGSAVEAFRAWKDYKLFKKRINKGDVSLVQTSTSLGFNSIIRDGLFLRYARKKGIKTIVFFRGWDFRAEKKAESYFWLFKYLFFKCDRIIALSKHTKEVLINWGYTGNVHVETTLYDKDLTRSINPEKLTNKFNRAEKEKVINLLFLSRIEKRKGICELLEAYNALKKKALEYRLTLNICGDGSELEKIKNIIFRDNIKDVAVSNFVEREGKIDAYTHAHIFILPSYGEGMPNAVLEAMGFGLPILTTPVGGINDFFERGENGQFVRVKNAGDIEEKILHMIDKPLNMHEISHNNYHKANKCFRSDIVAKRIESIFKKVINS